MESTIGPSDLGDEPKRSTNFRQPRRPRSLSTSSSDKQSSSGANLRDEKRHRKKSRVNDNADKGRSLKGHDSDRRRRKNRRAESRGKRGETSIEASDFKEEVTPECNTLEDEKRRRRKSRVDDNTDEDRSLEGYDSDRRRRKKRRNEARKKEEKRRVKDKVCFNYENGAKIDQRRKNTECRKIQEDHRYATSSLRKEESSPSANSAPFKDLRKTPAVQIVHGSAIENSDEKLKQLAEQQQKCVRAVKLKPMTKEQYEIQQAVVREVYDPLTNRTRLVRGDGEIIERIVRRQEHLHINRIATACDGRSFARGVSSAVNIASFTSVNGNTVKKV